MMASFVFLSGKWTCFKIGNLNFFCLLYQLIIYSMKSVLVVLTILALASAIPYRDTLALLNSLQVGRDEDPMAWQCTGCEEQTKPLMSYVIEENVVEIKAILSVYQEYTVLAFRYTATLLNVWEDILYAIQTQDEHACSGCKVQKEFDKMWNSIKKQTLAELNKYSHTQRLVITGISLGGALSCLSYVDIAQAKIFNNIEIVTFGAPRVGNKKWAAWFNEQIPSTRYFLKGDPIPNMPRCLTLICNYGYTGMPVKCDKSLQACVANSGNELSDMTSFAQNAIQGIKEHMNEDENLDGILDHIYEYKNVKNYDYLE